ncbi:MAG: hypothetical protein ABIR58_01015, partial [Gemmatimonadaceae bacterium]
MNPRIYSLAAVVVVAAATISTRACGQDTLPRPVQPGVRLGLSYPRGTAPKVIVMPVDTTAGDSVRAIIQRDLDFGDRIAPLVLDELTLRGLVPPNGDNYNFPLFAGLGAAAIVQTTRIGSGFRVALYDVSVGKRIESRDFVVRGIPPNRDGDLVDSISVATTARERMLRDSVQRRLRGRAAIMRRPPLKKDTRARRFIVRDSIRRDSTATAYVRRGLARWEDERRDSVALAIIRGAERQARQDTASRIAAAEGERMGVHRISDEIERWITGRGGIAASRIAYVHGGLIRVVDSDGANDRALTKRGLSLSPSWHPNGEKIVYSRFLDGGAGTQLEEINVVSGRTNRIGGGGLNITPVYSHDGSHVVYATSTENGTDLMMVSVADESVVQRLTFGRGTDNGSPTFSPDGRQIAFFSNRSRFPQIYTIDTDGANLELLTPFTPGVRSYRAAPDWSPDGRAVAYEQQNGDFQVWMINVRDKEPRRLTSEGENEGPSWAPDGRHLAISSTRGGSKQIWILDSESGRFRQLTRNAGARLSA